MIEYNTARRDYFKSQVTTPKSNNGVDLEREALAEALSISIENINMPSDWRVYFSNFGYTDAYSTNLSDLWYRWLTTKGFIQVSLRDKFRAFYIDGTVNL